MNKNKEGQYVTAGDLIREEEWKRKNTIAFKKKYKVSPNFVAFSLLIGGVVSFLPYSLYVPDNDWVMLFLPLIILGIVLRFMNNKYETGLDKFLNMFKKFKGF
ncbi:MAG: hypothetical protein CXT77_05170 [uncultured DHVE6 group euryarchaeote]|jgi:hypothetical protein|nr:MAG: hypothetical protein CXT77_05170 [uncultured DHVE6 group euryarchaeote]